MRMLPFAGRDPARPKPPPADRRRPAGRLVLGVLPWGLSVLVHGGLVVLALFAIWIAVVERSEQQIIPTVHLGEASAEQVELAEPPSLRVPSRPVAPVEPPDPPAEPVEPPVAEPDELDLLGEAARLEEADPFRAPPGAASAGRVEFAGLAGNARRVVFIIDATGSLTATIDFVLRELERTISELSNEQRFSVVIYSGRGIQELPPAGRLKRATASMKQHAIRWLSNGDIRAIGSATPVPAIRRALAMEPELLFLLSDNITGSGQHSVDPERLLRDIEQANTSRTRINTLQFLERDRRLEAGGKGTMQRIAEQTGGRYRFIGAEELERD